MEVGPLSAQKAHGLSLLVTSCTQRGQNRVRQMASRCDGAIIDNERVDNVRWGNSVKLISLPKIDGRNEWREENRVKQEQCKTMQGAIFLEFNRPVLAHGRRLTSWRNLQQRRQSGLRTTWQPKRMQRLKNGGSTEASPVGCYPSLSESTRGKIDCFMLFLLLFIDFWLQLFTKYIWSFKSTNVTFQGKTMTPMMSDIWLE